MTCFRYSRVVSTPARRLARLPVVAVGLALLASGIGVGRGNGQEKAEVEKTAETPETSQETEVANSDAETVKSIAGALRAVGLQGYDVEIFFESGTARLTGAIVDSGRKAAVTEVVAGIAGVETVDNQLKIEPRKIPYRVLVSLAVSTDPLVTRRSIERLRRDVGTVLERTIGETWTTRVEINDWLLPTSVSGLDRLDVEALQDRYTGTDWDRVMLVTVSRTGARFDLAGRVFDATSRSMPLSRRRVEYDRRGLATKVGQLARDMFGATVEITVGGAKEVELQVRAGEFPVADPDSAQLKPGDLLEPFLRYRDRKTRRVERIQPLTWTFLKVIERKRATVRCEVATALRNPLQRGGRGVELMAVKIDSILPSTRLILLPRGNLSRPLIGHRVVVLPRRLTKKAASTAAPDEGTRERTKEKKTRTELPPPRRLLSDRAGQVEIVVDEKMPLVWMYVMSGNSVLARVPFVPGRETETTLMLPDDSDRLGVEGHVTRLEGELIETVARRAVHMALATRLAEAEPPDWTRVDRHLTAIDNLPTFRTFEEQIDGIEFPAVQSARAAGNRVAVNRIRTLCRDARALLAKHLDESKIREFKSKLDDIRKTTPATVTPTATKAAPGN